MMEENPEVCFTVCDEYGTITNPVPAKTDTAYMSVMVFGKAQPIFDLDEATHMLQEMINKYVPVTIIAPYPSNTWTNIDQPFSEGLFKFTVLILNILPRKKIQLP